MESQLDAYGRALVRHSINPFLAYNILIAGALTLTTFPHRNYYVSSMTTLRVSGAPQPYSHRVFYESLHSLRMEGINRCAAFNSWRSGRLLQMAIAQDGQKPTRNATDNESIEWRGKIKANKVWCEERTTMHRHGGCMNAERRLWGFRMPTFLRFYRHNFSSHYSYDVLDADDAHIRCAFSLPRIRILTFQMEKNLLNFLLAQ